MFLLDGVDCHAYCSVPVCLAGRNGVRSNICKPIISVHMHEGVRKFDFGHRGVVDFIQLHRVEEVVDGLGAVFSAEEGRWAIYGK